MEGAGGPPVRQTEGVGVEDLLGEDFWAWMVLALGGAMVVGNILALARPRAERAEGELERPPVIRTTLMLLVGAVAAVWAIASILG